MKKLLLFLTVIITATTGFAADGGYLFVTFKGEDTPMTEQIYFGISKNGQNWESLNQAEPVLSSALGDKGVRDPYIFRSHDGKKVFMIATDLSYNRVRNWGKAAREGSQSIVIWESTDLVKWSEPRLVKVAADDAGCTWAPEAIYDDLTKDYLVFWASKNATDNFKEHRMWAARTKDFVTFSKPFIYMEKEKGIFDSNIVRENGIYYRFTKTEKSGGVYMEKSKTLIGGWEEVKEFSLLKLTNFEGPQCYQLTPASAGRPATWGLMIDSGKGYKSYVTDNLSGANFVPADATFPFRFRHGSPLAITDVEAARLRAAFPIYVPPVIGLKQTVKGAPNTFSGPSDFGGRGFENIPANANDNNLGTKYCNDAQGGLGTGLVYTPPTGPRVVNSFRFATVAVNPKNADELNAEGQDPLEITLEGSNDPAATQPGLGKFTSLYAGPTGLEQDPGRKAWGAPIAFMNNTAYASYRVLITRKREAATKAVQYSEIEFLPAAKK